MMYQTPRYTARDILPCYGKKRVKVDIYFTAIGLIDIPSEKEILAMMKEMKDNPQKFCIVA